MIRIRFFGSGELIQNGFWCVRYCVDCLIYLDSVPREIFNALETTRSDSSNCTEELADRVTKDTTISKRQIDLTTRMMLDQISKL